jgi:hypothetical protein
MIGCEIDLHRRACPKWTEDPHQSHLYDSMDVDRLRDDHGDERWDRRSTSKEDYCDTVAVREIATLQLLSYYYTSYCSIITSHIERR